MTWFDLSLKKPDAIIEKYWPRESEIDVQLTKLKREVMSENKIRTIFLPTIL